MNRNLAIIGASCFQLPLIEKAKELGYITHVFAWKANDVGESAADFFYPISIIEKDVILEKCRELDICGICSIGSDLASITVNYVACNIGLTGNSLEATRVSTNKHLMRLAFEKNGDPSPKSILVDMKTNLNELMLCYPVIVKPTDRSGSRGICKLHNSLKIKEAVDAAINEGFEGKALIEEFAEGQEYSVEYISFKGKHHFLALTLKHTTGAPHFIETGHIEPAPIEETMLSKIKQVVEHALGSLGIENGASHTEIKITDEGLIRIIEIGGRMGGDCIGSDLVLFSTGIDYVRAVIQVSCGNEPDLMPVCLGRPVEVRFIFTEEDLYKYKQMKKKEPDRLLKEIYLHEELIGHITDSSNRAGCYIIKR